MTKSDLMRKMHRAGLRLDDAALAAQATVSNRVRLGWRTWADLSKRPDVVQSKRRKGVRR